MGGMLYIDIDLLGRGMSELRFGYISSSLVIRVGTAPKTPTNPTELPSANIYDSAHEGNFWHAMARSRRTHVN